MYIKETKLKLNSTRQCLCKIYHRDFDYFVLLADTCESFLNLFIP